MLSRAVGCNGRLPHRFAIYFAPPPESALNRFGASWLGRDAWTGATLARDAIDGLPADDVNDATAAPRLYGFHATLKPPFRLAAGRTVEELAEAMAEFAARHKTFAAPSLRLAAVGQFLALVLGQDSPAFSALAEDAVRAFDAFRAPPTEGETHRRRAAPLAPRQSELLEQWGYPYVLDEWRFHLTLTGSLTPERLARYQRVLGESTRALTVDPLPVDAVCLFEQADEGVPFRVAARFPLAEDASP